LHKEETDYFRRQAVSEPELYWYSWFYPTGNGVIRKSDKSIADEKGYLILQIPGFFLQADGMGRLSQSSD